MVVNFHIGKVTIGAMTRTTTKVSIIKKSLKLSFLITFFNVQDVIGMVVIVVETMSTPNTVRNANVWILIVRISIPTVPIGLNRATVPKPMFLS